MKPPFPYYGGKGSKAKWIVGLLPEHRHYVEPFGGSLAVLLEKTPSPMETVNDVDEWLMTFWRVLRNQPEDLERVCTLTPHSRAEHLAAYETDGLTDLEKARRVWVMLSQGRGGTLRRTGWRHYGNPGRSSMGMPGYLASYVHRMPPTAERLRGVSLECRPALEVIADYGKHPDVCLYVDPPYLSSTRSGTNYRHEMGGQADHEALAEALHGCKASVILSGYPSDLYRRLYGRWFMLSSAAWTGNGIAADATQTEGERVEVVWSNVHIGAPTLFESVEDMTRV